MRVLFLEALFRIRQINQACNYLVVCMFANDMTCTSWTCTIFCLYSNWQFKDHFYCCFADPKLPILVNEVVAKLLGKWEAFDVQIELEYECIQEIKQKYPQDNYGCFTAVFHNWNVQCTVPFTWERVVAVLQKQSCRKHCWPSCRKSSIA